MKDYRISVVREPEKEEIKPIIEGIARYGLEAIGGEQPKSLAVLFKADSGEVTGGATGQAILGHFHLSHLWVTPSQRGRGYGSHILEAITAEADKLGCCEIRLDTMNPRSFPFYERHGYSPYARIPDYLPGFERVFYVKRI